MPCEPLPSESPTVSSTPCNIICSNQEPHLDTGSPQNVPPNKPVQKSEESSKLKQVASVNKNKNAKSPKRGTITSMFDAIIKRKLSPEKENNTAHRSDNHNADTDFLNGLLSVELCTYIIHILCYCIHVCNYYQ